MTRDTWKAFNSVLLWAFPELKPQEEEEQDREPTFAETIRDRLPPRLDEGYTSYDGKIWPTMGEALGYELEMDFGQLIQKWKNQNPHLRGEFPDWALPQLFYQDREAIYAMLKRARG